MTLIEASPLKTAALRTDEHHLFWPRRAYSEEATRHEFRSLPCTRLSYTDALVHDALHDEVFYFNPPEMPKAAAMGQLLKRHHKDRECGCYKPTQQRSFNLLRLPRGHELRKLTCLWAQVDREVAALANGCLPPPGHLPEHWVQSLLLRHHLGDCGCYRLKSAPPPDPFRIEQLTGLQIAA